MLSTISQIYIADYNWLNSLGGGTQLCFNITWIPMVVKIKSLEQKFSASPGDHSPFGRLDYRGPSCVACHVGNIAQHTPGLSETSFGMLWLTTVVNVNCLKAVDAFPFPLAALCFVFLPSLLPCVELGEAVADDGDGQPDDEDAEDGAEAAEDLAEAGDRADISVANLEKIS